MASHHRTACALSSMVLCACNCFGQISYPKRLYSETPVTLKIVSEAGREKLVVEHPRPLAEAADLLERRYGLHINYEDAPWIAATDLIDQTHPEWEAKHPGGFRALAPAGGRIELPLPAASSLSPGDEERMLQELVREHNRRGNPGYFRALRTSDGALNIIPARVKNAGGLLVECAPVLDTSISIPEQERSLLETLNEIGRAIEASTGAVMAPGTVPLNLFARSVVRVGARDERARDVLARALSATGWKMAWRLCYGQSTITPNYVLNVHVVSIARKTRFGDERLWPVQVPPMPPKP